MSFRLCGLALAWCVFVGVLPGLASAQETVHMASLSGRVTDPSGAVIAGAQITARQTDTNLTAATETDGGGRFRFPYLKVGPYELTVRQGGFADATRKLTLTVGAAFEVPVSLAVGTLETGVRGAGGPARITAVDAQVSDVIQHYWTNFAKTGNPNGAAPTWPKFDVRSRAYVQFTDAGPLAKEGLRRPFCDLFIENVQRLVKK